jgi:rhodanese-related sulfurtransferase
VRALIFCLLAACASDVSMRDAHRLVRSGARLLDVRSHAEFAERHAPGALNIPVEELKKRFDEVGAHDRPVVVYCHTGARAGVAVIELRNAGFTRVYNLGSLARWFRDLREGWPQY